MVFGGLENDNYLVNCAYEENNTLYDYKKIIAYQNWK